MANIVDKESRIQARQKHAAKIAAKVEKAQRRHNYNVRTYKIGALLSMDGQSALSEIELIELARRAKLAARRPRRKS